MFPPSDQCFRTQPHAYYSIEILYQCDSSVGFKMAGAEHGSHPCQFRVFAHTRHACESRHISAASVFFILLFLGAAMYLFFGAVFNYQYKGSRGQYVLVVRRRAC